MRSYSPVAAAREPKTEKRGLFLKHATKLQNCSAPCAVPRKGGKKWEAAIVGGAVVGGAAVVGGTAVVGGAGALLLAAES